MILRAIGGGVVGLLLGGWLFGSRTAGVVGAAAGAAIGALT